MFRLENWLFQDVGMIDKQIAYGNVYDNPKFPDGTWIHTSMVVEKDLENKIIKTLNSTYVLGKEFK